MFQHVKPNHTDRKWKRRRKFLFDVISFPVIFFASPSPSSDLNGPLHFLPPANEVWGKVIFLHLFVILFTGGVVSHHALQQGGSALRWCLVQGVCSGGVPGPGGLLRGVPGGDPLDGYCCGRYASYWNAFLFNVLFLKFWTI